VIGDALITITTTGTVSTSSTRDGRTFTSFLHLLLFSLSFSVSQLELLQTFTQYLALSEMASAPLRFDLKPALSRITKSNLETEEMGSNWREAYGVGGG
jgi:hypothetical protein